MRKLMLENMSFRWLWAVAVLALLVSTAVILTPEPVSAGDGEFFIVDDDGKADVDSVTGEFKCNGQTPVTTDINVAIGMAADAAPPHGDVVLVCPGLYLDQHVVVGKVGLTLRGITMANKRPVVDGGIAPGADGHAAMISITVDGVTVDNFVTRNAGKGAGNAGIATYTDNNFIINNEVGPNNNCGILLWDGDADAEDSLDPTAADFNMVLDNSVHDNNNDGIRVMDDSDNNTVKGNNVSDNDDGIQLQGRLTGASPAEVSVNTIEDNHVHNNAKNGIVLKAGATTNPVINNDVHNNVEDGILFEAGATGNTPVTGNNAHKNGDNGIDDVPDNDISEALNTFKNNGGEACAGCDA